MFFRTNLKYGLLQGMFWMMYCVMFPFLVQVYRSYGYNEMTIGMLASVASLLNVLTQPVWGRICDRAPKVKKILIIALVGGIIGSVILPLGRFGPFITLAAIMILYASIQPMSGVIDAWIFRMNARGYQIDYGFTRSFGSVFYAVTAVLFGLALDAVGLWLTTPAFVLCAIGLGTVALTIKEPERPAEEEEELQRVKRSKREPFFAGIKRLTGNSRYIVTLPCAILMSMGLGGASLFFPMKIEELGGGNLEYGISLFVQAFTEIFPLLLFTRLNRRFRSETLLAAAFGFTSLKVLCMGLSPTVFLAICAQSLQMFSYGLYLGAIASYIPRIVKENQLFTAQTLLASSMGISSVFSNFLGGWISSLAGVTQMITMASVLPATGCVIFITFQIIYRKKHPGLE